MVELTMSALEGYERIKPLEGRLVSDLMREQGISYDQSRTINKGKVGQVLELYIGLTNHSGHNDFIDGDLKCFKTRGDTCLETMAITQLIELDKMPSFEDSVMYHKIKKMVMVGIQYTDTSRSDALISSCVYFDIEDPVFSSIKEDLREQFEQVQLDFHSKCQRVVEANGVLRRGMTTNGKSEHVEQDGTTRSTSYLQIRSKDSKDSRGNYHPIFYRGIPVTSKGHAYYFKKQFMTDVARIACSSSV